MVKVFTTVVVPHKDFVRERVENICTFIYKKKIVVLEPLCNLQQLLLRLPPLIGEYFKVTATKRHLYPIEPRPKTHY